ncbi:hypothetical protein ACWA7J_01750 [Leptothrix sp. BB-4]
MSAAAEVAHSALHALALAVAAQPPARHVQGWLAAWPPARLSLLWSAPDGQPDADRFITACRALDALPQPDRIDGTALVELLAVLPCWRALPPAWLWRLALQEHQLATADLAGDDNRDDEALRRHALARDHVAAHGLARAARRPGRVPQAARRLGWDALLDAALRWRPDDELALRLTPRRWAVPAGLVRPVLRGFEVEPVVDSTTLLALLAGAPGERATVCRQDTLDALARGDQVIWRVRSTFASGRPWIACCRVGRSGDDGAEARWQVLSVLSALSAAPIDAAGLAQAGTVLDALARRLVAQMDAAVLRARMAQQREGLRAGLREGLRAQARDRP